MAKNSGKQNLTIEKIWDISGDVFDIIDDMLEEGEEIVKIGIERLFDVCALAVTLFDRLLDFIGWAALRSLVLILREVHDFRIAMVKYRKEILKCCAYFLVTGIAVVMLFSTNIDYEYSYNGRVLGVVKEQDDVLQILDLISEELSQEYESSIVIDPEQDITFKQVFSNNRNLDDPDTVLKRFTYLGDIQVSAYALVVDGKQICIVESEKVANDLIQECIDSYMKDDDTIYEYVGIAENVEVEPISTRMANIQSKSSARRVLNNGGQEEKVYKVKAGDTLYGICAQFDVTVKELAKLNKGLSVNSTLHIGDKIKIQKQIPLLTVETVEVSKFAESIKFDTEYKESKNYYQGEKVVTRAGVKGKQIVTARLTKHNGEIVNRQDLEVEVVKEPISKIVVKGTKKVPPKKGTGTFKRPVNVGVYRGYGMRWGRMHYGLDYAAPTGTAIHASDGGTVVATGWSGAFGYRVTVDHGGNFKTIYAHCSRIIVKPGDKVYQGQTIAYVGSTGRSTGPHCHFEILKNGVNVNPANYVR